MKELKKKVMNMPQYHAVPANPFADRLPQQITLPPSPLDNARRIHEGKKSKIVATAGFVGKTVFILIALIIGSVFMRILYQALKQKGEGLTLEKKRLAADLLRQAYSAIEATQGNNTISEDVRDFVRAKLEAAEATLVHTRFVTGNCIDVKRLKVIQTVARGDDTSKAIWRPTQTLPTFVTAQIAPTLLQTKRPRKHRNKSKKRHGKH